MNRTRRAFAAAASLAAGVVCAAPTYVVEDAPGYNCWPMIESVGNRLVCVYTMGAKHAPGEKGRGTYARTSTDGGQTWSDRVTVAADPKLAQSPVAKGLDRDGAALFWVRRYGATSRMALYRTTDGEKFELIAEPSFKEPLMQITDVFRVDGVGLMAFWFGGSYGNDEKPRWWGLVTSRDNGRTWEQKPMCEYVSKADWPTEPAAVALGKGRILVVARCEDGRAQFQLTSTDNGATWKIAKTNISDVSQSTPSLVYDAASGIVRNYYFQRGKGALKVRRASAARIFDNPTAWPEPEIVGWGNLNRAYDSGNANACSLLGRDYVAYYAGDEKNAKVLVTAVDEPRDLLAWNGRRVVVFGDSITDPRLGPNRYWKRLADRMHLSCEVYGVNGHNWNGLPSQVERAKRDLPPESVDAVLVLLGTNDFNGDVPRGEWWSVTEEIVNRDGKMVPLKKRTMNFDRGTFRGRVNAGMRLLRETYPDAQLVLLTPVHRGFAVFSPTNVQPDERYSRPGGLFIDDYVEDLIAAGRIWSAPVIDLYGESGLLPNEPWADPLISRKDRDRLHPSVAGHDRMARLIEARLRNLPPTFERIRRIDGTKYVVKRGGMETSRTALKADQCGFQWLKIPRAFGPRGPVHSCTPYEKLMKAELIATWGGTPDCHVSGYPASLWWAQYKAGDRLEVEFRGTEIGLVDFTCADGPSLNIVALGDSIVADTCRDGVHANTRGEQLAVHLLELWFRPE